MRQFALRNLLCALLTMGLMVASMLVPQHWLCVALWLSTWVVEHAMAPVLFSSKIVNGHTVSVG